MILRPNAGAKFFILPKKQVLEMYMERTRKMNERIQALTQQFREDLTAAMNSEAVEKLRVA